MAALNEEMVSALMFNYLLKKDRNLADLFKNKINTPALCEGSPSSSLEDIVAYYQKTAPKKISSVGTSSLEYYSSSNGATDSDEKPAAKKAAPAVKTSLAKPVGWKCSDVSDSSEDEKPKATTQKFPTNPIAKETDSSSEGSGSEYSCDDDDDSSSLAEETKLRYTVKSIPAKATSAKYLVKITESSSEDDSSEEVKRQPKMIFKKIPVQSNPAATKTSAKADEILVAKKSISQQKTPIQPVSKRPAASFSDSSDEDCIPPAKKVSTVQKDLSSSEDSSLEETSDDSDNSSDDEGLLILF